MGKKNHKKPEQVHHYLPEFKLSARDGLLHLYSSDKCGVDAGPPIHITLSRTECVQLVHDLVRTLSDAWDQEGN